jgi:hypothetical protein
MGLGRRDFLKVFGVALAAASTQALSSAISVLDDTYVNRKLGVAFQKPPNWYFNNIKEMGDVARGQILDLIDAETAKRIIAKADLPFISISQEPVTTDGYKFTPGINAFVEIRAEGEEKPSKYNHLFAHIKEPNRTIAKDIFSNKHILKNFKVISEETSLFVSNCEAIQYTSSFLFEHNNLSKPTTLRMNTLLIIQNEFWYTFRMYDAPSLGRELMYDYGDFINSIGLV